MANTSLSFKVVFRGALLKINITKNKIVVTNESEQTITLAVYDKEYLSSGHMKVAI